MKLQNSEIKLELQSNYTSEFENFESKEFEEVNYIYYYLIIFFIF